MPITLCFHENNRDIQTEIIFYHEYLLLKKDGSASVMQEGIVEVLAVPSESHILREIYLALPHEIYNFKDISNTLNNDNNTLCYTGINPKATIKNPKKFAYYREQKRVILDSIDFFFGENSVKVQQDSKRKEIIKVEFMDPIQFSHSKSYHNRRGFRFSYSIKNITKKLNWWIGQTTFTLYFNSLQSTEYDIYSSRPLVPITLWYIIITGPPKMDLIPGIKPELSKNTTNPDQIDLWLRDQLSEKDILELKKSILPKEDNRYALKRLYYSNINPPFKGYTLPDQNLPSTGLSVTVKYPELPRFVGIIGFIFSIIALILSIITLLR